MGACRFLSLMALPSTARGILRGVDNDLSFPIKYAAPSRSIKDDAEIHSHKRRLQTGGTLMSTHLGYGTHYVDIFVGNPAQMQSLVLSTHEDKTSFPCMVRAFWKTKIFHGVTDQKIMMKLHLF